MSALCLLERYLEDQGEGSIEAIPCEYPPSREHAIFDYDIVRKHIYEVYYSDSNNGLGEPDLPKIKVSKHSITCNISACDCEYITHFMNLIE